MPNNGQYAQVNAPIKHVHSNLDQEIIQITEDKLRLVLNEHIAHIEKLNGWIAPLGLLIAIITTFSTSDFKDAFLFKAPTWEAIFFIMGIISALWLLRSLYQAYKSPTIENIVDKIKNRSFKE